MCVNIWVLIVSTLTLIVAIVAVIQSHVYRKEQRDKEKKAQKEKEEKEFIRHIFTEKDRRDLLDFLNKHSGDGTVIFLNITLDSKMYDELLENFYGFTLMEEKNKQVKIVVCFDGQTLSKTFIDKKIRGNFICDTRDTGEGRFSYNLNYSSKSH